MRVLCFFISLGGLGLGGGGVKGISGGILNKGEF